MNELYRFNCYYKSPDDLHLIVDSIYELAILQYLIQLTDGLGTVHPSEETLRLKVMSKSSVIEAIEKLREKGFIIKIPHFPPKANEYQVCSDVINYAIDIKSKGKHRRSEKEDKAITWHMSNKHPDTAEDALVTMNNKRVIDKSTGLIHDKEEKIKETKID